LTSSLEKEEDQLRAFLAAWNALEIFINKVFSHYEQGLFKELKDGKPQLSWKQYLDRVQDVMRDKYRLADRFALVAFQLSPDDADNDYREFIEAKKRRDDLSHGQDVNETSLPGADSSDKVLLFRPRSSVLPVAIMCNLPIGHA
jgi:hypothetical protein